MRHKATAKAVHCLEVIPTQSGDAFEIQGALKIAQHEHVVKRRVEAIEQRMRRQHHAMEASGKRDDERLLPRRPGLPGIKRQAFETALPLELDSPRLLDRKL